MATLDFKKLSSNKTIRVGIAPSGSPTGITRAHFPDVDELNNVGGVSGMIYASDVISWNDWDFGTQASETQNEPSLADAASFEEFGQSNFGGGMSFYLPRQWHDNSNPISVIYDLTSGLQSRVDIATRLDGNVSSTAPFAAGDYVSVYRVESGAEQNPFTPGESKRRTVTWTQKGDFSHYTVAGGTTIVAIPPASFTAGSKGRIRASVEDREFTNALDFSTSDGAVIDVEKGGFYEIPVGATGSATVTIREPNTGISTTVTVTL